MLRPSVLRAVGSAKLLAPQSNASRVANRLPVAVINQSRHSSSTQAISNPTLAALETRWEKLEPQEQADLWMALRDRMKVDWHELTAQEKKAAYYIAFGPHGPRAEAPPGENWRILRGVALGIAASAVVFLAVRSFAGPPPKTMTKEWQEATNEYLKEQKAEPFTGISSEGYKGQGYIQSKPSGKPLSELSEDE